MKKKEEQEKVVVTSTNQSGGITAHTVNVNQAPRPELKIEQVSLNQPSNGEFHSSFVLHVEAPYPAANLLVRVYAPSICRIDLLPLRPGMLSKGHCGDREGFSFQNLHSPSGDIALNVVTAIPEQLRIEHEFS